jgi:hypothetical protein
MKAEITREILIMAAEVKVIDNTFLPYDHETVFNMRSSEEVYTHFFARDSRLLPFELYQEVEARPYLNNTRIEFLPKNGSDPPDTLGADGGVGGEFGPRDWLLSPVSESEDTRGAGGTERIRSGLRTGGVNRGPLEGSSGIDSEDDEEGDDTHKLAKIKHAVTLNQPLTVVLKGQYEWDNRCEEVPFQQTYNGVEAPTHISEPLQASYSAIEKHARTLGGDNMPGSCGGPPTDREGIEISVEKLGTGVRITYARASQVGMEIGNFPLNFKAYFFGEWAIVLGTQPGISYLDLTQRFVYRNWLL